MERGSPRSIRVDEDVTRLQEAVSRFQAHTGRLPTSLWELAAAEHLAGIPVDPDGNPYVISLDGQVEVEKPEDFPFITKGVPPDYKPSRLPKFHTKP